MGRQEQVEVEIRRVERRGRRVAQRPVAEGVVPQLHLGVAAAIRGGAGGAEPVEVVEPLQPVDVLAYRGGVDGVRVAIVQEAARSPGLLADDRVIAPAAGLPAPQAGLVIRGVTSNPLKWCIREVPAISLSIGAYGCGFRWSGL
jgi:hypothetical protein